MKNFVLSLYFIAACAIADAGELDEIFSSIPIEGSIVISNMDGSKKHIYNDSRAEEKYTVASTFKILNTLIAIQENIVPSGYHRFIWDGKKRGIQTWNQDQNLESAFKVSCVWCYQDIARKVGHRKYKDYLQKYKYGELPENFAITEFWLDGTLGLNSHEQINFLKQVYTETPPFSRKSYKSLKEIMLVEKSSEYSIYAKSGWAPNVESPVGWYIGYVESLGETWFFVTNLGVENLEHLHLRNEVTLEALKSIGALPNT